MSAHQPDEWQVLFGAGPVVIDGGLSTQLVRVGEDVSGALWTGRALLDNPAAVTRAHSAFAAAGADVVISASYQVSRAGFAAAGLSEDRADDALRASVTAARVPRARVAASVGPYGAILHDGSEYRGQYGLTRGQLSDFHRARIAVLVDSVPDLLAVETIPDALEAQAIIDVLADYPTVPAWMTFTAADGERLWAGQLIEDAVALAERAPSIVAVGINCTDPRYITELVTRIAGTVALPIVVYPNAGGAWDAATGEWEGASPEGIAFPDSLIEQWLGAGAIAIGGCCGTDDRTIRRIADVLARTGT